MIVNIVELLDQKDKNFHKLFLEAAESCKVDLMDKISELDKNKAKKVKTVKYSIKYNKEIQGIEIRTENIHICVCAVDEIEIRDLMRDEDEIKFAYIKTKEEGSIVEYNYDLAYDGRSFKLMPTTFRQGQMRPRISSFVELSDADLSVLKGEEQLHL